MYQLSVAGETLILGTLLEVLSVFRTDSRFSSVESSEILLAHCGQRVTVTRYNGALAVRRPGTARDLFLSMIDEIDGAYFRPNGVIQAAWQIQRSHWKLLYDAYDLTSRPHLIFSSAQIDAARAEDCARGRLELHDLLQAESERRFGFRYAGPEYGKTRDRNCRHEVHVAYALAEGLPVPEGVLAEYREYPDKFSMDMRWGKVLLDVPELRGMMSSDKARVLVSVMAREKGGITSQNAALLSMVMRLAPNAPNYVEVDDLLFRHGLVESYSLPDRFASPQPLGTPVSKFADVYRNRMADHRRDTEIARLRKERAAERVSQREFDLRMQIAQLEHGRETFAFGNEISEAIDSGDLQFLLDLMDCPDDRNRVSKEAVREVFDVKLLGVRAAARRRAVFELVGFDEAKQAEWEAAGAAQRDVLMRKHHSARSAGVALIHPVIYGGKTAVAHRGV